MVASTLQIPCSDTPGRQTILNVRETAARRIGHDRIGQTVDAAGEARAGVLLLAGAAGVVMLIACVNLTLLLLALLVDRRREMAVRAVIGARPGQLVAQVLTECALLGVLGAALGLMLAWLLLPVLRALVPTTLPRGDEVSLDPVVFLFAVGLAMAAALAAGLVPAWYVRRRDVQSGLRLSSGASRGDGARDCARWQPALLINLGTCGGVEGRVRCYERLLVTRTIVHDITMRASAEDNYAAHGCRETV